MKHLFYSGLIFFTFIIISCGGGNDNKNDTKKSTSLKKGIWRFVLKTQEQELPFQMEIQEKDDKFIGFLINGEEKIKLEEIIIKEDSIKIPLHIFDTGLEGKIEGNKITGNWVKYSIEDYVVPFEAEFDRQYRFEEKDEPAEEDFSGKWEVEFTKPDGKTYEALGIFEQKDKKIKGTFITKTGDYRYLDGVVDGKTMKLSTFDGEHAFLFTASPEDKTLKGNFWSGKGGYYTWKAERNEEFELPDANELTFLKEGYDKLEFSFPNLDNKTVSLDDDKFKDKVVIVQIFGSWCPNCMDETAFLSPYYNKHKDKGLEIIGLAYEMQPEFEHFKKRMEKLTKRYDIQYDFLFAGTNDKANASKTLPMLNHIMSYPTTIFIDRKGKVRKIHTGFAGPGTGKYYETFVDEFTLLVNQLLEEKS